MFLFRLFGDLLSAVGNLIGSMLSLVIVILLAAGVWSVFWKMGEPGWKCLIPIYNAYILTRHLWAQPLLFLLIIVPVVNVVFGILSMYRLALAFGKGVGFAVGLILLPPVFFLILGLGTARYQGN